MARLATIRRIRAITYAFLLFSWGTAWASIATLNSYPNLISLPWIQSFVGILVAGTGCIAATLSRYLAAKYENRPFYAGWETAKDTAASVVIGLGGYYLGAWHQLSEDVLALSLLLGGHVGARLLAVLDGKILRKVADE